jgi:hypothetical protein
MQNLGAFDVAPVDVKVVLVEITSENVDFRGGPSGVRRRSRIQPGERRPGGRGKASAWRSPSVGNLAAWGWNRPSRREPQLLIDERNVIALTGQQRRENLGVGERQNLEAVRQAARDVNRGEFVPDARQIALARRPDVRRRIVICVLPLLDESLNLSSPLLASRRTNSGPAHPKLWRASARI